jgi:hypothetical protein
MVGWATSFCCPPSVSNGGQRLFVAHPTLASNGDLREYYLHQTEVTPIDSVLAPLFQSGESKVN